VVEDVWWLDDVVIDADEYEVIDSQGWASSSQTDCKGTGDHADECLEM
jgi:hypothetical protein